MRWHIPIAHIIGVGEYMLERRFGVRSLVTEGSSFRLNGKPYYMRGVCEHCYYPDTVNPWHDKEKYRAAIVSYMQGREFSPKNTLDQDQLHSLISTKVKTAGANVNLAFNVNDKTTKRCK